MDKFELINCFLKGKIKLQANEKGYKGDKV